VSGSSSRPTQRSSPTPPTLRCRSTSVTGYESATMSLGPIERGRRQSVARAGRPPSRPDLRARRSPAPLPGALAPRGWRISPRPAEGVGLARAPGSRGGKPATSAAAPAAQPPEKRVAEQRDRRRLLAARLGSSATAAAPSQMARPATRRRSSLAHAWREGGYSCVQYVRQGVCGSELWPQATVGGVDDRSLTSSRTGSPFRVRAPHQG